MNGNARVLIKWREILVRRREIEVRVEWLAEKLEIENWRSMDSDALHDAISSAYSDSNRIEDLLGELSNNVVVTSFDDEEVELEDIEWEIK